MTRGQVLSTPETQELWPELGIPDASTLEDNRFRFVIVLENEQGETRRVRLLTWQTNGGDDYRNMNKDSSRHLAESWEGPLMYTIESGDVERAKKSMRVE